MATAEELRGALAQLTVTVQLMATNTPAAVAAAPPPGVPPAAARPVVLSVEQRINSSSAKLVQLSRQDSQCTDKEKGMTANPAYDPTGLGSRQHLELIPDPTSQITSNPRVVNDMPETDEIERSKARCTAQLPSSARRTASRSTADAARRWLGKSRCCPRGPSQ